MEVGLFRGLITVLILVLFIGIWAWSWSRSRHTEFDAAARLPLGDDRRPASDENIEEQQS